MGDELKLSVTVKEHGRSLHRISEWLSAVSHSVSPAPRRDLAKGGHISAKSVLRVALGIVFVISGVAKMRDIYGFSNIVSGYGILPDSLVVPVSIIIPFAEFISALILMDNYHMKVSSFVLLG